MKEIWKIIKEYPYKTALGKFGIKNCSSKQCALIENNQIVKFFGSQNEADRWLSGKRTGKVNQVCKGIYQTTQGKKFKIITRKEYDDFVESLKEKKY